MEHFARVARTCSGGSIDHIHLTYGALEEVAPILLAEYQRAVRISTITGYGYQDDERAGLLRLPRLLVNFDAEARPASGLGTPFKPSNIIHSHKNAPDMKSFTRFCSDVYRDVAVTYQSVYLWSHKHHQWFYQARREFPNEPPPFVNHWVPLKTALMKRGSSADTFFGGAYGDRGDTMCSCGHTMQNAHSNPAGCMAKVIGGDYCPCKIPGPYNHIIGSGKVAH